MIVVIADDLSGAAEIAGIGLRYDLSVILATNYIDTAHNEDLLVIDTDTRSMSEREAEIKIEKLVQQLMNIKPRLLYKKTDSVLRGHILPELNIIASLLGYQKILIAPANPSLGRTIKNGIYYYNQQPIHLSSFSNDPEFPISSSEVSKMIRADNDEIAILQPGEKLADEKIMLAEIETSDDLQHWATTIGDGILPAGGSEFFSALLREKKAEGKPPDSYESEIGEPELFICGTTFSKSRDAIRQVKMNGGPVSYMPAAIVSQGKCDEKIYNEWAAEIINYLEKSGKAIVAIDPLVVDKNVNAKELRECMALVVAQVCTLFKLREIFIEGGSTAAAVIRQLGFETFLPKHELAQGVVRMQVKDQQDLYLTIKPGSYDWPEGIWNFS